MNVNISIAERIFLVNPDIAAIFVERYPLLLFIDAINHQGLGDAQRKPDALRQTSFRNKGLFRRGSLIFFIKIELIRFFISSLIKLSYF